MVSSIYLSNWETRRHGRFYLPELTNLTNPRSRKTCFRSLYHSREPRAPALQMRKATRHKCTSLFCLGVVVVPLVVFGLSAFFAIWLWLIEADQHGHKTPPG